jgi:hypothetical protein
LHLLHFKSATKKISSHAEKELKFIKGCISKHSGGIERFRLSPFALVLGALVLCPLVNPHNNEKEILKIHIENSHLSYLSNTPCTANSKMAV